MTRKKSDSLLKDPLGEKGYHVLRNFIPLEFIATIQGKIAKIINQFVPVDITNPLAVDKAFIEIAKNRPELKNRIYTVINKLSDVPALLSEPRLKLKLKELDFTALAIQSAGTFFIEPHGDKHLFAHHQDLRDRISFRALQFWIPLNGGKDIGGISLVPRSHLRGPLKHFVNRAVI